MYQTPKSIDFDYFKSKEIFDTFPDKVCYIPECNEGDETDRYTKNDILRLCDGDELKAEIVFAMLSWEHPEMVLDSWDEDDESELEIIRKERNLSNGGK